MAREDLHFRLRIPEDLKKRLAAHADLNGRSMTAEIIARLTASVDSETQSRAVQAVNEELRLRVAELEGYSTALQHGQRMLVEHLARAVSGEQITADEIKADLDAWNFAPKRKSE